MKEAELWLATSDAQKNNEETRNGEKRETHNGRVQVNSGDLMSVRGYFRDTKET